MAMTNFEYMVRLEEVREMHGYKQGWIYNQFIMNAPEDIEDRDFYKLAKICGYKAGWAFHKVNSWRNDLDILEQERDESRRQYQRDKRFVYEGVNTPNTSF